MKTDQCLEYLNSQREEIQVEQDHQDNMMDIE